MPNSDVLRLLAKFRLALAQQDAAALQQVIDAYRLVHDRLGGRLDALVAQIAAEGPLTSGQFVRLSQYKALERDLRAELERFGVYLNTQVSASAKSALLRGDADAYQLLKLVTGRGVIRANFGSMSQDAIQTMIAFLQPDSPLYQAINALAGFHSDQVLRGLVEGIAFGDSPRATAAKMADLFTEGLGRGLTDALRITRTAQLYSYREANRVNFILNNDVVTGWYWIADLRGDPPPCLSCLAQHGTRHELTENLDDHDNGRCAAVPEVLGQNPLGDMQTGEAWFNEQNDAAQADMMGPGRYAAWKDGKFDFAAQSQQVEHPTWGHVRSVVPLKNLIGEGE